MHLFGHLNQSFGWIPNNPNVTNSNATLNSSAIRFAWGFMLTQDRTLNSLRIYINSKTGTPADSDLVIELFSDNGSGAPNASLGAATLSGSISATAWADFTFSDIALTAATQYWIVMRNAHATPASNNFGFRRFGASPTGTAIALPMWMYQSASGPVFRQSADSGATWTAANDSYQIFPMRLGFASGGGYTGLPLSAVTANTDVYSTRMLGVSVTTPSNAKLRVAGISMAVTKNGSPTGVPVFKIYDNAGNLVATTRQANATQAANCFAAMYLTLFFETTQVLSANTTYRVMLAETAQADGAANNYSLKAYTFDTDANSTALRPGMSNQKKILYDGASWTETAADWTPFTFILDTADGEFSANTTTDPGEANVRSGTGYFIDGVSKTGTLDVPTVSEVKIGVTFDDGVSTGTYDGSDRWTDPGEASVKTGVAYKANSTTNNKTGTYTGADRWSDPGVVNVRSGTAYKADSTTNNRTGTCVVPAAADVREGVSVDATTGLIDLPAEAQVAMGISYDNGTKTGTLLGADPDAIAAAVWNSALADHTTSSTFGGFIQKLLTVAKFLGLK